MNNVILITIDPGKSQGGIALKNTDGIVQAFKMPQTIQEIQDFFIDIDKALGCQCVIEHLHAGVAAQGARKGVKQIWSQSENYSALMCGLYNAQIPVKEVTAAKWMGKITGHGQRPKDYKERKDWLKAYAIKRFPQLKVTNYSADALALLDVAYQLIQPPVSNVPRDQPELF